MMTKLPIIGSSSSVFDALYALMHVPCGTANAHCRSRLAVYLGAGSVHIVNSGITAFYLILEALKTLSGRTEVVLPAYTAGSLIVAVQKAGLKPVLCDVSLQDFNADAESIQRAVSADTLAVVAVHMFGIPLGCMETLKNSISEDVYVIEDCCQAMGARIKDMQVGSFGDIAFWSFNRGKNLPANNGGCIVARTNALEQAIRNIMGTVVLPGTMDWCKAFFKTLLFTAGTKPFIYGVANACASGFRETAPPRDLSIQSLGNFQAALCSRSLRHVDALFMARYRNGTVLLNGLTGNPGVRLPVIKNDLLPVYNRFPVLFDNADCIPEAQKILWQRGIESSLMYEKPLHHMFDLGYDRNEFPNACFLAQHLLTLPVHTGVREHQIKMMIDTLRGMT